MDANHTIISYPREATIFASVCAVLFCGVGVIGNFITIVALVQCPRLRKHATTAFVLSLCVSDLIFCVLNMPLTASRYIHQKWTLGPVLCQLFPVMFYGNVAVSLLNMVAITINRYLLISCHQLYVQFYSLKSICVQLFFVWGCSFAMMLPPLLGIWGQLGLDPSTFSCTILKKDGHSPKKVIFLIGFVLPCIAIILCYSCIFWRVKQSRRKLKAHEPKTTTKSKSRINREKEDGRLTRLMLIIFVCFVLCFLPLMLTNVFDDDNTYPTLHVLASILAWLSSVINPFIYAGSNRQYRSAYRKLFDNVKSNVKSVQMNTTSANKEPASREMS